MQENLSQTPQLTDPSSSPERPPWEDAPDAVAPDASAQEPASPSGAALQTQAQSLAQREEDLAQREQALSLRERRQDAREALASRGLPAALLEQLDLSSQQGLEKGLNIASLVQQQAPPVPNIPKQAEAPRPTLSSYRERLELYQQDPQAYRQAILQ